MFTLTAFEETGKRREETMTDANELFRIGDFHGAATLYEEALRQEDLGVEERCKLLWLVTMSSNIQSNCCKTIVIS